MPDPSIWSRDRCAYVRLTNHEPAWQVTTDERRSVVVEVGAGARGNFKFCEEVDAFLKAQREQREAAHA